jgi:hypothetical protein
MDKPLQGIHFWICRAFWQAFGAATALLILMLK